MKKIEKGIYAIGENYVIDFNIVSSYGLACFLEQLELDAFECSRDGDLLFIEGK